MKQHPIAKVSPYRSITSPTEAAGVMLALASVIRGVAEHSSEKRGPRWPELLADMDAVADYLTRKATP